MSMYFFSINQARKQASFIKAFLHSQTIASNSTHIIVDDQAWELHKTTALVRAFKTYNFKSVRCIISCQVHIKANGTFKYIAIAKPHEQSAVHTID